MPDSFDVMGHPEARDIPPMGGYRGSTPAAPPGAPGPGLPAPGPSPIIPPGFNQNPQQLMQQIMQMILGEQLGRFFQGGPGWGPSQFTPGGDWYQPPMPQAGPDQAIAQVMPRPRWIPGNQQVPPGYNPFQGSPSLAGPTSPSPVQGPRVAPQPGQPGYDPNMAYASGGPSSMGMPGTQWGPSMGVPMSQAQGPMGTMQGPMSFLSSMQGPNASPGGDILNQLLSMILSQRQPGV